MRNKVIGVTPEIYSVLHNMRRELPGKKFESFNDVITRLLQPKEGMEKV